MTLETGASLMSWLKYVSVAMVDLRFGFTCTEKGVISAQYKILNYSINLFAPVGSPQNSLSKLSVT